MLFDYIEAVMRSLKENVFTFYCLTVKDRDQIPLIRTFPKASVISKPRS